MKTNKEFSSLVYNNFANDNYYNTDDISISFTPFTAPPCKEDQSDKNLIKQALETFKELEDNWNGFDAIAPTHGAINSGMQFIDILPRNCKYPTTVSVDEGNIVMTWKGDKEIVELIIEPIMMHLYRRDANGNSDYVDNEIFDDSKIPQKLLHYIPTK